MGTTPGNCDDISIKSNRTAAVNTVGTRKYGLVNVTVLESDAASGIVKLALPKTNGQVHIIKVAWGDLDAMWAPCPSTLASSAVPDDPGPPPPAGATGKVEICNLVLEPNGHDIGVRHEIVKWPRENGDDDTGYYQEVKVAPTKLSLFGLAPESGVEATSSIDLLDPALAKPGQTITTDGGLVTLQLTASGCAKFHVPFKGARQLARAVEIIDSEHANARLVAAAWQIVAIAAEQYKPPAPGASDKTLYLLQKVLPKFASGIGE